MGHILTLLDNFRLTTAEITYCLPDHPQLVQLYIWQELDLPPDYPKLVHFLDFWNRSLDGKLHSIRVTSAGHLVIPQFRLTDFQETLH